MAMNFSEATGDFIAAVRRALDTVVEQEGEKIAALARRMADSIRSGGVVHLFGTGHSHLVSLEAFHRAGGLAPVNTMIEVPLTEFYSGRGAFMERLSGYARIILDYHDPRPGEVLVIISNSGINPVPVEMAMEAKERGLFVAAVTNIAHARSVASRHASGKRLFEIADLVVDTHGVPGDAAVPLDPAGLVRTGPLSTLAGVFIVDLVMTETAALLYETGQDVPLYRSANLEGSDEHNQRLVERYRARIKGL